MHLQNSFILRFWVHIIRRIYQNIHWYFMQLFRFHYIWLTSYVLLLQYALLPHFVIT